MKTTNGTTYHEETPDEVIRVLDSARQNRTRLHISLGDTASGRDWLEEFESHGYVSRSMGPEKVPLLVSNRRSLGGDAILDHCIVRIRTSAGGRVLWQHPSYHHGQLQIRQKTEPVTLPERRSKTAVLNAMTLLSDDDFLVRFATGKAIGRTFNNWMHAVAVCVAMLKDDNATNRAMGGECLLSIRRYVGDHLDLLTMAMADVSWQARIDIEEVLAELRRR